MTPDFRTSHGADAIGQQTDKVLDGNLVATRVDLDVVAIEIDGAIRVAVDGSGEGIARIAGHVIGEHEDDLRVRNAEALHGAIEGEDISQVAVVEPESGCRDQNGPVRCMFSSRCSNKEQERKRLQQPEDNRHCCRVKRPRRVYSRKERVQLTQLVI